MLEMWKPYYETNTTYELKRKTEFNGIKINIAEKTNAEQLSIRLSDRLKLNDVLINPIQSQFSVLRRMRWLCVEV